MAFRIDAKCFKCETKIEFIHGKLNQTQKVEDVLNLLVKEKDFFKKLSNEQKKLLIDNLFEGEIELLKNNILESASFYINTFYVEKSTKYLPMLFLKIDGKLYKREYENAQALIVQKMNENLFCPNCDKWSMEVEKIWEVK
ncbi:hypothetical protein [[Mycoplasma] mobile]|nr:hypothetical protein [[Mycoplasma] mobile]